MEKVDQFNNILNSFRISAACRSFKEYKNACFYDIELKPGTRVREIEKYSTELALALKSYSIPKISIISENGVVRFEILKSKTEKVPLMELGNKTLRPMGELMCLLGETLEGKPVWMDMVKNPHMIIAGTTGSGKSTLLHVLVANLLLYPKTKLYLMDPKNIEFFKYENLNSINKRVSIAYSYQECLDMLELIENEMDERYADIKAKNVDPVSLPYITLIIDEFADIILQDNEQTFHKKLCKIAQKSRAAKIHIILATQRPSVNIVDGAIKANFPARLSCKVSSHVDSKVILDATGAQNLVGEGDAIIKNYKYDLQRFQAAYIDTETVCNFFK